MKYIEDMNTEELKELYNNEVYPGMTNGDVKRADELNKKITIAFPIKKLLGLPNATVLRERKAM